MEQLGKLSKMSAEATTPIQYSLVLDDDTYSLNDSLGKTIRLDFLNAIHCIGCSKPIKKSYQQGYCFPCTQRLARCDFCILKPVLCHYHLGTCREPEWGLSHCMTPHIVYLAYSSQPKVGITRKTQVPTRWIDQGATQALPLFEVATRRVSGHIEVAISEFMADKTNWRKMLQGVGEPVDLFQERENLLAKMDVALDDAKNLFGEEAITALPEAKVTSLNYPVLEYPKKISSLSFDKTPTVEGTLLGIKGQYLILDTGVINIRKHTGYSVKVVC